MIIDWMSATVQVEQHGDLHQQVRASYDAIAANAPALADFLSDVSMVPCAARAPYSMAVKGRGVTIMLNPKLEHCLIEISGKGCANMREQGDYLEDTIIALSDRLTRLDVALDIPDVTPDDVIEAGVSDRFRSRSVIRSDTGTTHYIGSPKSDRFCRVYRYNPPHPRSDLCRVEVVHRKVYARILANAIIEHGVDAAAKSALASYKLQHWAIAHAEGLPAREIDKDHPQTVRWLAGVAGPSFRKLVREGVIDDPEEFLRKYFLPSEA